MKQPHHHDLRDEAHRFDERARRVLEKAITLGIGLATAESCTGGLLASLLTDIEGCSKAFDRGFVPYTEQAKQDLLGIEPIALQRHGAVSAEIALAMAQSALARSQASVACAVTGFAGSAGGEGEDGLVHIAVVRHGGPPIQRECHFGGRDRAATRQCALAAALEMLEQALDL